MGQARNRGGVEERRAAAEARERDALMRQLEGFGAPVPKPVFEYLFDVFVRGSTDALHASHQGKPIHEDVPFRGLNPAQDAGLRAVRKALDEMGEMARLHAVLPRIMAINELRKDSRVSNYISVDAQGLHISAALIRAMAEAPFIVRVDGESPYVGFNVDDLVSMAQQELENTDAVQ